MITRLQIPSVSGGVSRQAPSKRLRTEVENMENCLCTLENSGEKRPPLSMVLATESSVYLDVPFVDAPEEFSNSGATGFNTDNIYVHWLDIDGFQRYCIIVNRAAYDFDPVVENSFTYEGHTINMSDFITVYRVEPTRWYKETVDDSWSYAGFNRAAFEYLSYGNKSETASYNLAGTVQSGVKPLSAKDTFGSIDWNVGCILWNRQVATGFLPDRSGNEIESSPAAWLSSFANNEYIHSGDDINYKRTAAPVTNSPLLEDTVTSINGYWTNVRDDIVINIDPTTLEEEEVGQSVENFSIIPQFPVSEVYNDVRDFNGYRAWRMLHAYYDAPKLIPAPGGVVDWYKDHLYSTSPLDKVDRDGFDTYLGLGKVYSARNSYLSFQSGFYRASRYKKNPYFDRVRSEGVNSVFDHRRMPLAIYKDDSTGVWKVRHLPMLPRRSGTAISNPGPEGFLAGEKIKAMSFWKNRLWIATDTNVVGSSSRYIFDFWIDEATTLTDADPIDLKSNDGSMNRLTHMVSMQDKLVVFSSGSSQFEVMGGSPDIGISPLNASIKSTSFYSTSKLTVPCKMGGNVFFTNDGNLYMYLSSQSFSNEYSASMELSRHNYTYLPRNVSVFAKADSANMVLMVDDDNPSHVYTHIFRSNAEEVIQNSSSRWTFSNLDSIEAIQSYESDLYFISRRPRGSSGPHALIVYFGSTRYSNYATPSLDWLAEVQGNYNGENTVFELPYYEPEADRLVKTPAWGETGYQFYEASQVWEEDNKTHILVAGDHSAHPFYVGRPYEMVIELSEQVQRSSENPSVVIEGVLTLKRITANHKMSGNYDISVSRNGRPLTSSTFFPTNVNSILTTTNQLRLDPVGEHLSKILAFSNNCKIYIKSDYPTYCNISNIEILGNFRIRNTGIE